MPTPSTQLAEDLPAAHKALLGIALATLLAAVLGLLNIGLATVRDRTRELTIRRATGATRSVRRRPARPVILGLLTAVLTVSGTCAAVTLLVPLLIDPASALHRRLPDRGRTRRRRHRPPSAASFRPSSPPV
ncbi:hypothetical protein [Kitasatospora sp. NPDC087314]|uniref:hypothetical protein n=1 Tax=Kitasatospora sp. NPDC087314 TaxID=3364068 RepID=UPI00382C2B91